MSSKSKRKHAQKGYNRANTGASADAIKEIQVKKSEEKRTASGETETDRANDPAKTAAGTEISVTEAILTPKEFKKIEQRKKKQAKIDSKLAKKRAKKAEKDTPKDKKGKEKGEKRSIFAGIISELKKVHWPSWHEVWKATGIVLGVVVVFGIVVLGIDRLLGWLYEILIGVNK
jgi:preprotein translocase subunit SecE